MIMSKYWIVVLVMFLAPVLTRGAGGGATIDYAMGRQRDAWLRHPVLGDPSFDTFARVARNPLHRGQPPLEWPVNGFLFEDPPSGRWYIYVGEYSGGYAIGPGKGMRCTVYRSVDKGQSWERVGPIFPEEPFTFQGDTDPVGYAPDVSVVYEGGKYHLVYDYVTSNSKWENLTEPKAGQSNGVGYAWSDRPEGPFHRTPVPVYRVNGSPWLGGKYRRLYAATLLKRDHDWLVLAMMDSGTNYSWALVGMTAKQPEGPYSPPEILRCVDEDKYHPPLLEFYPAFMHKGSIYAPATSVALNRNFQAVFRARIEKAMQPDAWELAQEGSVWHAEDVENEQFGLWGQTFSGVVSGDGTLHAMFPSRDRQGMGTINLASRPWDHPYREQGFTISGHQGPSLTLIDKQYGSFRLTTELSLRGQGAIVWGWQAPLGPNQPSADATLHPLTRTRHRALELEGGGWRIVQMDERGTSHTLAQGRMAPTRKLRMTLEQGKDGQTTLSLGGKKTWSGRLATVEGPLGIFAGKDSHVEVSRFVMEGKDAPGRFTWLASEAIVGAGAFQMWEVVKDPNFRFGEGAVSLKPGARGKWNIHGTGFALWMPRGPRYGQGEVLIDGRKVAAIDAHAGQPQRSAVVWRQGGLKPGRHTITLRATRGVVPLDVLESEP